MRSASVRFSIVFSAALLALVLLGSNVLAQTVSLGVETQFSPNPVPVCVESDATLGVSWTAPPPPPYQCSPWKSPSLAWSITGATGVEVSSFDYSSANLTANICSYGVYTITVTVTMTWVDSCGNTAIATDSITLAPLTVVAVASITPLSEVQQKNIGDTLTKADFSITTNPPDYVALVNVPTVTIQLGDNNIKATCGCSSASTDVFGVMCSGSLSDLIVGRDGSDDSVNFTALIQGCGGTYSITGSGPAAVIDGGDTSGDLIANQSHSGIVYVSATPPTDPSQSRLPSFLNDVLVYGLAGIPGSVETLQVNGQSSYASYVGGKIVHVVAVATAGIPIAAGISHAEYTLGLRWWTPGISPAPGPNSITTTTTTKGYNPNLVSSTYTVTAKGRARSTPFGFKYTEDPIMEVFVNNPSAATTTCVPVQLVKNVWELAEVMLPGRPIISQPATLGLSADAPDGVKGKTQIQVGLGLAELWVSTDQNNSKLSASWSPPLGTWSSNSISVEWYPQ